MGAQRRVRRTCPTRRPGPVVTAPPIAAESHRILDARKSCLQALQRLPYRVLYRVMKNSILPHSGLLAEKSQDIES